jgi:ribA/ribD-fused uncharacterized protein
MYPTAEHLYQASKTESPEEAELIRQASTPGRAKRLGGRVKHLIPNWDQYRVEMMLEVVREKFEQNPILGARLLNTGYREIIEGNWWNDTYWGVCKGEGKNMLGKILMLVRHELRREQRKGYRT